MSDLEDRVAALEARVDRVESKSTDANDFAVIAAREAMAANEAHQKNISVLNALRETQVEHGKTLAEHTTRLDSIDARLETIEGSLGNLTLGMHTIEGLLLRIAPDEQT